MSDMPRPQEDQFYTFKPFVVPKYHIKFERAAQLTDIPGYVWYSPAPLYLWGRFSESNLADAVQRHDLKIFWYKFDQPIFSGLQLPGDNSWNHALWAAREDQWNILVDAILETVQFDIPQSRLYQYALQKFSIYDPLAVDAQKLVTAKTPRVPVNVFAVLTNERQYAFDTRKPDLPQAPAIASFKPSSIHVDAARTLFATKNLTQDKAFARYKEIMTQAQDLEHQKKINQYRR